MAEMNASASTVVGYFETQAKAEQAIDALVEAGFTSKEIGVATRGGGAMGGATTSGTTEGVASKASEQGHAAGEKTEGAWEKVKSFFGGNDPVEPYADEQRGGEFASREVTPGGSDDYEHDHLHGSLEGLTGSGDHAKYFGSRMQQGNEGVVVTVTPSNFAKSEIAERILEQNGADLGKNREAFAGTTDVAAAAATGEQNIKLYGEVLRVHKDRVSRGEVRLRKEVHTDMQTIQVPVTREELVIERVPVTGVQATDGTADAFSEREIRIPLSEEHASVEKQAILREEVRVGKREVTETESFNESVRSEDLKVDDATTSTTATANTYKQ